MKNIKKGICALLLSATNFAYAAAEQSLADIIADVSKVENASQISQEITPDILKRDELIKLNNIDNKLLKGNKLIQEDQLALKGEELIKKLKNLKSEHQGQKSALSVLENSAENFKKDRKMIQKEIGILDKNFKKFDNIKTPEKANEALLKRNALQKNLEITEEKMKETLKNKKNIIKDLEKEVKNAKKEALNNLKIQKASLKAEIKNASKSTTDDAMKNLLKARKKEINQSIQEIDPNVLKKFASKLF